MDELDSRIRFYYGIPLFFLTFSNMITISAPFLPQEYIDILAKQKAYPATKIVPVEKEESFEAYIGTD
jgi:hypothetical protein